METAPASLSPDPYPVILRPRRWPVVTPCTGQQCLDSGPPTGEKMCLFTHRYVNFITLAVLRSYVLIVCTVPLPPAVNPIAVDKYINFKKIRFARSLYPVTRDILKI